MENPIADKNYRIYYNVHRALISAVLERSIFIMDQEHIFEELIDLAATDSQKSARKVALTFYKILRKKGFNNEQIIDVAGTLLDCLVHALDGYKERSKTEDTK